MSTAVGHFETGHPQQNLAFPGESMFLSKGRAQQFQAKARVGSWQSMTRARLSVSKPRSGRCLCLLYSPSHAHPHDVRLTRNVPATRSYGQGPGQIWLTLLQRNIV
jgi:hypothetical protein